jgi:hypothetical protein
VFAVMLLAAMGLIGWRVGAPAVASSSPVLSCSAGTCQSSVVWITTANAHYAIDGVRAGATLAAVAPRLKLGKPISERGSQWYLAPDGSVTALLKVHAGIVQEAGITTSALAKSRTTRNALLGSVS